MAVFTKHIEALTLAVVAIFAPIQAMLIATGVLIFADLFLGVWAAIKQKHPITSAGFSRTVTKIFVYEIAIMLGYVSEHYVSDMVPIVKLIGSVIALVEVKSIMENLDIISGKPILKTVIEKLSSQNGKKDA
jgi:hypothetical protein